MSFNRYYQSELSALRQLGKRFAERHPTLAPFLGQSGRDPDVERLLEGFAFLTGRLHQRLDDELPELTHSLMHLLWPNYMRPLPALSMLEFDPLRRPGPALWVPRHTPVESREIAGTRCRFRTAYATEVLPLGLTALGYQARAEGALLSARLHLTVEGHLGELRLQRLRLHLSGERHISQTLYLNLLRHLDRLEAHLLDASGNPLRDAHGTPLPAVLLDPAQLQPLGFADDEALLPGPANSFAGYRLLQEYFAFQDKYLFVELGGLDVLQRLPAAQLQQARGLELRFSLSNSGLQRLQPSLDNLRLHCTPVVNLFSHDALPIRLDHQRDQYRVLPAELEPAHCGVFSIDQVTGWQPGGMGYQAYVPFESFLHASARDGLPTRHYSVRQQPSLLDGSLETYLRFAPGDWSAPETLSIELTCTNQNLPQQLRLGDICQVCEGTPDSLSFRNISAATPSYAPALQQDVLWKLISHMSLNYLSLNDVGGLKAILETYDLPRYHDRQAAQASQRLLDGLRHIQQRPVDRLLRGLPIRGIRTELSLDSDGFRSTGELFLFASVLNEFFALYVSLNAYHELHARSSQGDLYQWTPRLGQQPLL
ncbi:type VI secretion system baseplate subunit TssF [Pseudomonas sp. UL073]|uniref:Type VI secretion system baseplate subunit TssF n=1 Tax=Zestomonas insulae TaxID=2809017 RepID=A0ABS2IN24_9GAMM|nr:type VI secretion system baseplate subunit TssF [Pseudomonas insulae]MBM7063365.1 type VI secretion system baseplate subunit TssF [Pseudomonas insulae]